MSPTQRSLKKLKADGYRAQVVEKWNPWSKTRKDLFDIVDILAMKEGCPLLAIQCTTTANLSARIAKAPESVRVWLSTGNALEFWGWRKQGPRGKRKTWTLTRRPA